MSQYGSWSVKGVDDRARAIAKEKARLKGITLGDYINNLLLEGHSEAGPRDTTPREFPPRDVSQFADYGRAPQYNEPARPSPLDQLAQRIEAVEARSTLAITGIDQSVLGLLARLENTENSTSAMTAEVERIVDELRETHESLHDKVGALEADDSGQKSLEAMKALEDALGKLAAHVYEESRLSQDETAAVKGRVEAGFSDLNDRVEGMEIKVESTLATAAERVEKAVEQAELRAEGTTRHLSERFSTIESSVATKLAKVDEVDTRMNAVEGDVSGAITSMESTLTRIQDRLHRAETTTDTALKALESTFANLDDRIDTVAEMANPEKVELLRQELEQRFDALAEDLRASVDQTRRHLADEIERAAAGQNPELMGALETRVNALESSDIGAQIENELSSKIEDVSAQLNGQIVDMSVALAERMSESEERSAAAIDQVGEQLGSLSDSLDARIAESENRSAAAIEQVGEQVATAIKHVQARQEKGRQMLADTVAEAEKRQEARLSDALGNVSERLAEMQTHTASAMSPVQRAIVSLAGRLEALEDFNAPPLAEPTAAALPDMPELEVDTTPIEMKPASQPDPEEQVVDLRGQEDPRYVETIENHPFDAPSGSQEVETEADFMAALPDFDEEVAPDADLIESQDDHQIEADAEHGIWADEPSVDEPYETETETEDDLEASLADALEETSEAETDPLTELGSWDESQQEARDSDVFGADDELTLDPEHDDLADLLPAFDEEEELAHNADELLSEIEDELAEEEPPEVEDPTDYLSRARNAAIAAASDSKSASKGRMGRRSAASMTPRPTSSRKMPILVAASALAVAAAGAGGWVALRGKTSAPEASGPTVATKSSLTTEENAAAMATLDDEPTLTGVEFVEQDTASLEETLFEDEGSAAGTIELAAPTAPVETATAAIPTSLPEIPSAMTLESAAQSGDPVAQFQLGEARLAAQDYAAAADYIQRAAQQGLPAAQYRLSKLHERGNGVPRDINEARAWTERAAIGGNINAMHDLAVFYADGEGGPQSYAASAEWFRKAADFGVVDSQYNLALMYENGLGISPSQTEALYWYEVAAANGDASASGNIATLRQNLSLESAQEVQRRASAWTVSPRNAAANGDFGTPAWQRSSRAQVEAVQTVLNALGYDAGPADGLAGAGTRTAIRAFQADNGLPTTGTIDAALVATLNSQTQGLAG